MAVEWCWIPRTPSADATSPRGECPHNRIPATVAQIDRLYEAAMHQPNPQLYPFVRIALGTLMRKGEILAIKQEHVDLARQLIHIPKAVKAGSREQPMLPELAAYLAEYLASLDADVPWLFPSRPRRQGIRSPCLPVGGPWCTTRTWIRRW